MIEPDELPEAARTFLVERHLATLTTLRADGRPHVVPVGFSWQPDTAIARVICSGTSQKARNARRGGPAVLCQVDGGRWLSLQGDASVDDDPAAVGDAERRYALRYREPRPNPLRVVVCVQVSSVLGSATLLKPSQTPLNPDG